MYKVCPKCGMIAEYNAYYGRFTCTRCPWESESKIAIKGSIKKLKRDFHINEKRKPVAISN